MLSAIATPTLLLPAQAEPQAAGTDPAAASFLAVLMAAMVGVQPANPAPQAGEAVTADAGPAAGPARAVGPGVVAAAPAAPPFLAQSASEPAQVAVPVAVPAAPTVQPSVPVPAVAPAEAAPTASAPTPVTALVAALAEQDATTPDLIIPELSAANEQPPSSARPGVTAAPAPTPAVPNELPTAKGADPSEVAPARAESDDSPSVPAASSPSPSPRRMRPARRWTRDHNRFLRTERQESHRSRITAPWPRMTWARQRLRSQRLPHRLCRG